MKKEITYAIPSGPRQETWPGDGERFWADYTGNGLFARGTGIFCGEISGNVPDGAGSCVAVHTWYPDSGGVGYLRLDGQWGERRGRWEKWRSTSDAPMPRTHLQRTI